MHSFDFDEYGATVHANSDFSGEATIQIKADKVQVSMQHNPHGDGEPYYEIKIPAGLLKQMSEIAIARELIGMIEERYL